MSSSHPMEEEHILLVLGDTKGADNHIGGKGCKMIGACQVIASRITPGIMPIEPARYVEALAGVVLPRLRKL